jgi:hypothetical protein
VTDDSIAAGHDRINAEIHRAMYGEPTSPSTGDDSGDGGSSAGGTSRESRLIGGPSQEGAPATTGGPDDVNENLRAALRRKRGY